jgi:hypothetical protein
VARGGDVHHETARAGSCRTDCVPKGLAAAGSAIGTGVATAELTGADSEYVRVEAFADALVKIPTVVFRAVIKSSSKDAAVFAVCQDRRLHAA